MDCLVTETAQLFIHRIVLLFNYCLYVLYCECHWPCMVALLSPLLLGIAGHDAWQRRKTPLLCSTLGFVVQCWGQCGPGAGVMLVERHALRHREAALQR